MSDDIPTWAAARAHSLIAAEPEGTLWSASAEYAFARYIAEHEEPPVDPLLIEARKVLGDWADETWGSGSNFAAEYRNGVLNDDSNSRLALAALKRGIELGSSK